VEFGPTHIFTQIYAPASDCYLRSRSTRIYRLLLHIRLLLRPVCVPVYGLPVRQRISRKPDGGRISATSCLRSCLGPPLARAAVRYVLLVLSTTSYFHIVPMSDNHRSRPYDTRCCYNVQSIADMSQLNLPHGPNN